MKLILTALCITCLGFCFQQRAKAQDPVADLPDAPNLPGGIVEFDLLVVQLPEGKAIPLIPKLRDTKRSEGATTELIDLVSKNEAVLVGWPTVATRSGQRAVTEQVVEFRYATEYEAAHTAKTVERIPSDSGNPGTPVVPVEPGTAQPAALKPEKITTVVREFDAVPSAFETRNAGVTLEIEPVLAPDLQTVDISFVLRDVVLLEMRRVEIEDKSSRKKTVIEQPLFRTNAVTTSTVVKDGDYTLLGTFKVSKPSGYTELFILHTRVKKRL